MVNPEELWVGDWLLIKASKAKGRFEGQAASGALQVRVGKELVILSPNEVEITSEPEDQNPLKEETIDYGPSDLGSEIDLHMEALDPKHQVAPDRMLDFQLSKCKAFLNSAIAHRRGVVQIIHGKGTGLLRSAVHHYLRDIPEVDKFFETNDGGCTEIWLKFY